MVCADKDLVTTKLSREFRIDYVCFFFLIKQSTVLRIAVPYLLLDAPPSSLRIAVTLLWRIRVSFFLMKPLISPSKVWNSGPFNFKSTGHSLIKAK